MVWHTSEHRAIKVQFNKGKIKGGQKVYFWQPNLSHHNHQVFAKGLTHSNERLGFLGS